MIAPEIKHHAHDGLFDEEHVPIRTKAQLWRRYACADRWRSAPPGPVLLQPQLAGNKDAFILPRTRLRYRRADERARCRAAGFVPPHCAHREEEPPHDSDCRRHNIDASPRAADARAARSHISDLAPVQRKLPTAISCKRKRIVSRHITGTVNIGTGNIVGVGTSSRVPARRRCGSMAQLTRDRRRRWHHAKDH